ncbi:hypothetical protein D3C80_1921360 [compost metagenome]
MARVAGISPASVQRIWATNDIKPYLTRTFKLSNDPQFEEKLWDVIGLYLVLQWPANKVLCSFHASMGVNQTQNHTWICKRRDIS